MPKPVLPAKSTWPRLIRFLVVGGGSALVQLIVLAALQEWFSATAAFTLSWFLSTALHYLANRFWALPSGRPDHVRQLGEYLATIALCYGVNLGLFEFCHRVLGVDVVWSAALAIPPSTALVFWLLNGRVFRPESRHEKTL